MAKETEIKRWFKKRYIPILIIVALIIIRLILPYIVKDYVNKTLQNMDGYTGSVEDIDLHLYRGAYQIINLNIYKVQGNKEAPFVSIPVSDLSIEWKSLFKGSIVAEIDLNSPKLHMVLAKTEEYTQTGTEGNWVETVKELTPFNINRFAINDGEILVGYYLGEEGIQSQFHNVNFELTNIRNVEDKKEALPSSVTASGNSPTYSGELELTGRANLIKEVPDFNYDASFIGIELESLNPLFKYYTKMDFEEGTVDLFSELAVKDSRMKGYFKPIINDAKIFKWKEEDRGFFQAVKEFFAEGIQEIFENQGSQQTATRIEIEGTLENVTTDIFTTIIYGLGNAYWKQLSEKLDETIEFNVLDNSDKSSQSDEDDEELTNKEKRQKRRAERKAEKESEN